MNPLFFLFLLFASLSPVSSAEVKVFDVLKNGKSIGEWRTEKKTENGRVLFTSHTEITTWMVVEIKVLHEFDVTMENGQVTKANFKMQMNGKDRDHTATYWENGRYRVVSKGLHDKWIDQPITFPIILLMFKEPVGVSAIFSEKGGFFHDLHSLGNHSYKKINEKGYENFYHYQNGKLQRAEINSAMASIEIVLKK